MHRQPIGHAIALALAIGLASGTATAADPGPAAQRQVWTDRGGAQVWMNGYGECWHSAYGPPPGFNACNPRPVARAVAAPRPVVAAAPPQPVYQKTSFDADVLFDFDKAVLRPEGRTALDAFVGQLSGVTVSSITATGHTDRLGSDRYNQALSERRAATVRAYLIARGVNADSLQAQGMGERQPVTKAGDCTGRANARVIACLQPDRRVDVDLTGTRQR